MKKTIQRIRQKEIMAPASPRMVDDVSYSCRVQNKNL